MISLEAIQPNLEKIVESLANIFNVEVVIFDTQCHLIASTQNYLDKKGDTVHTPSLEEVLFHGNVLVNQPGYMKSCIGCRFKDHCPSTIEILNCIKFKNNPIGVMALTSFTKEGHDLIMKNIDTYLNLLKEISDLIGIIVFHNYYKIEQKNHVHQVTKNEFQNSLDQIKGNSKSILQIKNIIRKIAKSTSSVLITGETGTGKELVAKAIHENSNRSRFPLISINCASIPESLFESELFGYEEGAFTGAKKGGKLGKIELAQGGTLFLDEIGELPLFMQSKLLRVLQEHSIEKVGGIRSIPINVRFIAATNRNLEKMIQQKEFRPDLYYRLNVIPLKISPLRNRKEDIEILAIDFLKKYSDQLGKQLISFSLDTIELLKSHDWPGNVRELENAIEYAVNIEDGPIIYPNSLPESIIRSKYISKNPTSIKRKLKELEAETIKATLDKYGWDVAGKTKAAKELGIGLRTLYRKLKVSESV